MKGYEKVKYGCQFHNLYLVISVKQYIVAIINQLWIRKYSRMNLDPKESLCDKLYFKTYALTNHDAKDFPTRFRTESS